MNVSDLKVNQSACIVNLTGERNQRMKLLDNGLVPGTIITVQKIAPLGDPIQVGLRSYQLTLRKEEALLIVVDPTTVQGASASAATSDAPSAATSDASSQDVTSDASSVMTTQAVL